MYTKYSVQKSSTWYVYLCFGKTSMPLIIDSHIHAWGSSFPNRPFPWTPDPFDTEQLLNVLDANGVAHCVDITPIMYQWDNEYGLDAVAKYPTRMRVFGRFDPFATDAEGRLSRWMLNSGAAGVRLTFYGNDLQKLDNVEDLEPFWTAAEKLGVRVAVFAPDGLWSIVKTLHRHPQLRLVIDHMGLGVYPGCTQPLLNFKALFEFAPFPQVLVKISGVIEVSRDPYPFRDAQDLVAETLATFGADRLMWGSNFPVVLEKCPYESALAFVDECNFDSLERDYVLGLTCERMLAESGNQMDRS